jgi:hypothetical protein
VRRRPWLALVVLVLLGISAVAFASTSRRVRGVDDTSITFDDDIAPFMAPAIVDVPVRTSIAVTELPIAWPVDRGGAVLSIAPKTSPPR